MPIEPTPDDAERLLEQACGWLSKMHSGDFSMAEQQRLLAWRAADPAHDEAWQKAQALWQGLERLRGRTIPGAEPLLQERYRNSQSHAVAKPRYRRRFLPLAVACSAVLAVTLAVLCPPQVWRADYLTGKGEQRSVTLADGSRVILNTSTALRIHFDDSVRRVELLAGEAFFEVAKNPQRPFVVSADGSEVRAIGTAFDVRLQSGQARVELVEGIVEIQDAQRQHRERLTAGQSVAIGSDSIALQSVNRPESMALWRDGYLQFDGLPLHEAVAQINQYRPGRVVLLNKALADKRISGLFRLDALDQAIASLKAAVPELQTVSITPYLVVLR
ncbi:FecR family protein [Methylomonas montana]|uniref:FecR family protein n=1 Tax=Methylomonas montana TaxID=3058963 RepID=UPI002658065E|nr:FecR family protein [Methylomonas montana]WKJ91452.1 FecR family protein [Methylomonas montana]